MSTSSWNAQLAANPFANPFATTDPASLRGIEETLIKSFAIHFAVAATFGHLMSLRNFPEKHSAHLLLYVLGFFAFPMLPLAQVLRQLRSTTVFCFNGRCRGLTFYLSACCGVYVAKSETEHIIETKPLIQVDPNKICRKRASYNALWVGRVIVLLAVSTQYCGVALLWYRRARYAYKIGVWEIDTRNLQMVSGGLTAAIISLVISFLNIDWTIKDQPYDEILLSGRLEEDTPLNPSHELSRRLCNTGIFTNAMGWFTCQLSTLPGYSQLLRTSHRIRSLVPYFVLLNKVKYSYVRFNALSLRLSNIGLRIVPLELQWDLELAYVLHLFVSLFILPISGFNRWLFHHPREFFKPFQIYIRFSGSFRRASPRHWILFGTIYLLPFIAIFLHFLLWIMATKRIIKFIPKTFCKVVTEADFWFRSGRTVFSIPLMLLMMLLPLYVQISFIKFDFGGVVNAINNLARFGHGSGTLWKDPLEDRLYII
jgi:hypothetical protein